jgi:hypothetical protein
MEARLKSGLWVQALTRRCDLAAVGVAVIKRGDGDAGAILIKLWNRAAGASVLAQTRRPDGTLGWMRATGPAPVPEPQADDYIARQRARDPDLWVIEIDAGSPEGLIDDPIIA